MSTRGLALLAALVLGLVVARAAADPTVPAGYVVERYATGLGAANALAFGPDGLLYITDYQAGRLLRRTCAGALEVVASGLPYAVGVAFAADGRLFVAAGDSNVYEIVRGVPRVFASGFSYVSALDVWANDLYVTNSGGNSISKISIATGAVSVALSNITNPHGMSIDSRGDMYFNTHSAGGIYRYDFENPPQLLASIPAFSGTYTGEGFDGLLFWGQYRQGSLHRYRDGVAEVFATGFAGGAAPPVIGPNQMIADGPDAILVADGHDVWRISREGSTAGVARVTLKSSEVAGCKTVTGLVTLSRPAPGGGAVVRLSDSLAAATTPATLALPAGATCKSFSVNTVPVLARESGLVSATLNASTRSAELTVRPMGPTSVTLTPIAVVGSQPVVGKVTLECKAGPGPVTVDLSSSNPAAANPVAASIAVPQWLSSTTFDVTTNPVLSQTSATISGTANGITKSKKLTVKVAAAVSPTSLRFGNVTVGTTSGVLSTTLSNRGAVPYSITSIGLAGTSAKYFAQANDCPPTLAAGATCRVDVRFAPTVTGSKSAQLRIATSAKSTALSVALSGTGVVGP